MLQKNNSKYEKFWTWFSENEDVIFDNIEENGTDIAILIQDELTKVSNGLHFEIPFLIENEKRDFIISADGIEEVFEDVITLKEHAPKLQKFNVIAFRPRTYQKDQVVEMDGIFLSYEDVFFQYELTDLPIDINVYIRDYDGIDNRYIHAYFILLDTLIGEYDAVTLIGDTHVYPLKENETDELIPIVEIVGLIDKLNVTN